MDHQRRKKLTFITIGLIFFLNGVEYAVILPTIWKYLQSFEAEPFFLGLTLSAFSLSGLLFGPLYGFYSDRTHTTKGLILLSVLFQIAGNLMYFLGYSKWILLTSRFVAGIGGGVGSSIFGFLTKVTSSADRAGVFAAVMACRQAGLLIGPGFNFFLRLFDFHVGPLAVNKYNAPGLFMCVLWSCFTLLAVFMYSDFPPPEKTRSRERSRGETEPGAEEDQAPGDEEEKPLIGSEELAGSYGSLVESQQQQNTASPRPEQSQTVHHDGSTVHRDASTVHHDGSTVHHDGSTVHRDASTVHRDASTVHRDASTVHRDASTVHRDGSTPEETQAVQSTNPFRNFSISQEFLREEVVVLLAAQFIILFNQTVLETMVTPLTQRIFDFGELENSFMYCVGGLVIIVGFVFVRWLTRCVEERVVLCVGLGLSILACAWFLVFLAEPRGTFAWQMTEFVFGFFLQVAALPFFAVAQVCLFSKVTAEKTQGFSQGVRRSVGGLATILGPLWAGGLTNNMYVMMGVVMGLLLLLAVMLVVSFRRLVPAVDKQTEDSENC